MAKTTKNQATMGREEKMSKEQGRANKRKTMGESTPCRWPVNRDVALTGARQTKKMKISGQGDSRTRDRECGKDTAWKKRYLRQTKGLTKGWRPRALQSWREHLLISQQVDVQRKETGDGRTKETEAEISSEHLVREQPRQDSRSFPLSCPAPAFSSDSPSFSATPGFSSPQSPFAAFTYSGASFSPSRTRTPVKASQQRSALDVRVHYARDQQPAGYCPQRNWQESSLVCHSPGLSATAVATIRAAAAISDLLSQERLSGSTGPFPSTPPAPKCWGLQGVRTSRNECGSEEGKEEENGGGDTRVESEGAPGVLGADTACPGTPRSVSETNSRMSRPGNWTLYTHGEGFSSGDTCRVADEAGQRRFGGEHAILAERKDNHSVLALWEEIERRRGLHPDEVAAAFNCPCCGSVGMRFVNARYGAFLGCRLFPSCRGKRSGREVELWRAGVVQTGKSGRRGEARKLTLMCEVETPKSFRVHAQGDPEVGELLRLALPKVILRAARAWRYKRRVMSSRSDASFRGSFSSASALVADISPASAGQNSVSPVGETTAAPFSSSSDSTPSSSREGQEESDTEPVGFASASFPDGVSSSPTLHTAREMLGGKPDNVTPVETEDQEQVPIMLRPLSWLPRLDRLKTGRDPWRHFIPHIASSFGAWHAETKFTKGSSFCTRSPEAYTQSKSPSSRKDGKIDPRELGNVESLLCSSGDDTRHGGVPDPRGLLSRLADQGPPIPWDWTSGWVEAPRTVGKPACSVEEPSRHRVGGKGSLPAPFSFLGRGFSDPALSGEDTPDSLRYVDGCVFRLEVYELVIESLVEQTKEWCSVAPIPGLTLRFFRQYCSEDKNRHDSFFISDRQTALAVANHRLPPLLRQSLFPFQLEGVLYTLQRGGRALIGDEMGLGKTLQALALLSIYRAFPVLIVVPASLRLVWAEAIERWLPELSCPPSSLLVIFGSDDRPALPLTTASGVGDLRSNPDRERCKDSSVNLPGDEGAHDDSSKTPSQARGGPTFVPWPTKSSGCPASRLRSCPSGTGTQVIASDAFQCRTGSGSNSGVQVFPGDDSCHTYRGSTTEEPSLLRATATTFSNEEHRKTGSRQENQSATSRCEIKVARVSTVGARVGGPVHTAAATQPSASSHCSSLSSAVTPSPSCSAPAWAAPKIVLISYEMCRRLPDFLAQMNFRMVIVDESHKLRTPASAGVVSELEADTTRRVLQLIKAATYAVLLSGTPSVKHPFDLFSQIDALRPPMEPHSWRARQQRVRQEWSALVGATRKHHFEGEERTEGEECHVEEKGAANRTDTWRSVKAEEGELVDDAVRVAETAEVRTGELPDLPDAKSRLYGQEGNILRADRIQFGEEYCTCVTTFGSRKRYGISPRSWELHLLLKTAVLIRRTKLAPRPSGSPNSKECSSTEGESAAGATSQLAPVTGDAVKPQNAVTQQVPRERIATLAVKPLERRVASPECHGGTQVDVNSQRKSRVGDARYGAEGGDHAKGELAVERAAAHFDGRPKREGAGEDEPLAERGGGDGAEKEGAFLGAAGEVESVADCQAVAPPCVRILQGLHLCRENRAVRAIAAAAVLMRPGFEMLLDFVKEEHEKQKEEEKVSMLEQTRRELKIPLRKGTRARGVNAPGKKRKLREEEKRETGKNSAQHENGETNGREHEPKVEISEKDNVENCIEGQPNAIEGRRLVVNVEEAAGGTTKGCDGSPEGKGGAPSRSRRRQRDSDPAGKPSAQDEDLRSSSTVRATGSARKETEGETPGTPMCAQGEGGSCDMLVADDRSKEEQEGTCGRSQEQQERFSNAVARLSQELVGGVDRWFVKTEAERVGLSKVQSAMQWLEEKFLRDSVFEGDGEKESSYTKIVVFAHHRRVLDSAEVELRRIQRKMSRLRIHFPAGHSTKTRSAKGGRNEEADRSSEARQGDQGDLSTQQGARFAFEFVRIDGSSAEDEKLRRRERFARNPSCKVALLSVTASSHGVDLSNANVCVFLELLPDQHELLQAEGRLHRRGQCRQVVTFFLINKLIGPLGGPLEARCDPARGEDEEERQTEGQQCKERDQGGDEGSRGAKGKGRQNRRCAGNPVASRGANGKADAMNKVCDGDEWVSQCSDSSEDIPSPPLLCESGTLLPGTGKSGSSSSCCPLSVLRRFRKAVRRETARLFAECERADLCAWQRYSTCAAAVHHVVDGPVRAAEGDAFPLRIDSQAEWTGKPGDREQGNQGDVSTRSGAVAREMVSSSGDGEHSRETENLCVSPTDFGEEAAAALASRTAESGGLRNGEDRPFMQAHESPGATSMELNENSRVSSGTIEEVLAMEDKQAENRQDLRGISFTAGHRESGKFTPETPSAETGVVPGDRKHVASARVCTVVNVKSSRCGSPTGLFHPEDLRFIVSSYTKRLHLLRVIRCRREFHTGAAASEVFQGATASSFHPTAKPFCPMFTSDGTHFLGDSKPHLSDVRAEDSSTPLSAESLTVKPIGVSFPAEELISFAAESSLFDSGADPLSPGIFGSYACLEHQEQNSEKIPSMNCLGQGARGIPTTPADEGEDGEAVSVPQCSRTKDFMFSVERANKSNRSEETASETQKSGDSHHLYCGWDLQSVAQQRTAKENQGCTPSLRQWAAVFYREYLSLTSYQRRRIRRSYAPLGLRAWLATAPEFCSPPGRGSAQTLSSSILLSSPSFLECGRPACPSLQFSPSPAFCSFGSSEQRGNNDDEDTRGQACGGNIAPRDRIQWPRTDSAQVPLSEPPSSAPSLPSTTLKAPRFLRDLPEKALAGGWGGVADFLCVGASQSSRQETSPERKPVVSKYYAANLPKPPGRGGRKRHASEIAASRKTEDEGKPSESLVGGTNFAACVGGRTSFRATPDTGERGQAQETQKQNVSRAALLSVDEPVAVVRGVAGAKKRRTQRATRTCSRKQGKKRDEAPAAAVTSGELPAPPRQQPKKPKKPYARTRREASEVTLCLRWDEDEEEPHELADFCRCLLKEAHSGGFHSGEVVCATSDLPLVDAGPDCGASRKECLLQKRNYRWSSNFGMVASRWWSKITTEQERSTYLSAEQVGAVQHGDRNLREHSPRSRASPFTASTDKMQEKKRTGCLSFFPDRDEVRHVESRNGPVVGTGCRVNTHGSETGHNTASVSLSGYHSTDFHSPSSLSMSGDSLTHSLTLSGDAQGVRVLSQSTAPTCVGETTDTSVGEALSCSLPPPPLGCLAATTFNAPQFPVSASSASSSPCPIPSLPVLQQASTAPTVSPCSIGSRFDGGVTAVLQKHEGAERDSHKIFFVRALVSYNRLGASPVTYYQPMSYRSDMPHEVSALPKDAVSAPRSCPFQPLCMMCYRPLLAVSTTRRWLNISTESASGGQVCLGMSEDPSVCGGRKRRNRSRSRASDSTRSGEPVASADSGESGNGKENKGRQRQRRTPVVSKCVAGEFSSGCREGPAFDLPSAVEICRQSERAALSGEVVVQNESVRSRTRGQRRHGASESREKLVGAVQRQCTVIKASGEPGQTKPGLGPGEGREARSNVRAEEWEVRCTDNDLFCSGDCRASFFALKNHDSLRRQIFRSDRGVCSSCGVDCIALLEGVRARKETNQRVSAIAAFICSFAPTFTAFPALCALLIREPVEGNAWHADHIIPVHRGGGLCGLTNIQTLCRACHQMKTNEERKARHIMEDSSRKTHQL